MKLAVATEQQELGDAVRRFLADRAPVSRVRELMETPDGIDRQVWQQAGAQLGLQGIAIPEEYGGAGFSFAEQAIVLEELGAALYGGPYLASAVLAATALLSGSDEAAPGRAAAGNRLRPDRGHAGRYRGRRIVGSGRGAAHRGAGARTAAGSWTGTRASCWTGTPRT